MVQQYIPPGIKNLWSRPLIRDFLLMILFSCSTMVFGLIQFKIPGVEGSVSDLREIPLLASVFYLSNPLLTIGISALSSLAIPPEASYLTTFVMHAIGLLISWYFYNYIKRKSLSFSLLGVIWFGYTILYFVILLVPVLILTNYLEGMNLHLDFNTLYLELIKSLRFEILSTAIVISLFLVQLKYRVALRKHLESLEKTVEERTRELSSTIEELKTTQQQLIQAEKMASLGTLSSGIAHEINNPLNFIQGGWQIIEDLKEQVFKDASADEHKECETAQRIINDGLERAKSIVESLMLFTSHEPAQLTQTDLHEIIDSTLLFLNHKKPENLIIKKDYQLKTPIPLYRDKIYQIITYIIDNALFELHKKPDKQGLITISTRENKNSVLLSISNNGGRIPESHMNKIFDPFFTTKDPGLGVGLGLSLAYSLVNDHKGKISAKNTDDGVRFIIELFPGE